MSDVKKGSDENKYPVSVYSTTQGEEECFLGKRCQLIKIIEANKTLKYLKVIEEKRLSKGIDRSTLYW